MKNISSRAVESKMPKRAYLCPGCEKQFSLHPGAHWHTCNGFQWRMSDAKHLRMIEAAVSAAFAGLQMDRALSK